MCQVWDDFILYSMQRDKVCNDSKIFSTAQNVHQAHGSPTTIPKNGTVNKAHDDDSGYRVERHKSKNVFRFTDAMASILPPIVFDWFTTTKHFSHSVHPSTTTLSDYESDSCIG